MYRRLFTLNPALLMSDDYDIVYVLGTV